MKKLRSNSKRKWIVGGVMFFGGIGLLTTGFATWVVGTQVLSQKNDIGITVDTAKNNSITIDAKLVADESFYLGEETVTNSGVNDIVSVENGKATDFTITFETITIECGAEYYEKHFKNNTPFQLVLETDDTVADDVNNVLAENTVTENLVDKAGTTSTIRSGSSWSYIDLTKKEPTFTPETGVCGKWNVDSGIKKVVLTNVVYTFGWGDFFGGIAPSEFYNNNGSTIKKSLSKIDAVEKELTAMHTALSGEGKFIPFTLTLAPGNAA